MHAPSNIPASGLPRSASLPNGDASFQEVGYNSNYCTSPPLHLPNPLSRVSFPRNSLWNVDASKVYHGWHVDAFGWTTLRVLCLHIQYDSITSAPKSFQGASAWAMIPLAEGIWFEREPSYLPVKRGGRALPQTPTLSSESACRFHSSV